MPQISWISVHLHNGGLIMKRVKPLMRHYGRTTFENLTGIASMAVDRHDSPEIIFVQDARQYDRVGSELLYLLERHLAYDGIGTYCGFLTPGRWPPPHELVLIHTDRVQAAHRWRGEEPDEAAELYGYVELVIDGDARFARSRRVHAAVSSEGHRAIDYLTIHGWTDPHTRNGVATSTERCLIFGGLAPVHGSTWVSEFPATANCHHHSLSGRLAIAPDNYAVAA